MGIHYFTYNLDHLSPKEWSEFKNDDEPIGLTNSMHLTEIVADVDIIEETEIEEETE